MSTPIDEDLLLLRGFTPRSRQCSDGFYRSLNIFDQGEQESHGVFIERGNGTDLSYWTIYARYGYHTLAGYQSRDAVLRWDLRYIEQVDYLLGFWES